MIYLTFDSDGKANLHWGRGDVAPRVVRETNKETQITTTRFAVGDGKSSVRVSEYDDKGNAGQAYRVEKGSLRVLTALVDSKGEKSVKGAF